MDPKEGGIEAFQSKFFQKLLNHKKNCPKLQTFINIGQNCKPHKFFLGILSLELN